MTYVELWIAGPAYHEPDALPFHIECGLIHVHVITCLGISLQFEDRAMLSLFVC